MLSESRKQGLFAHGSTYGGRPVSAAVAVETLAVILGQRANEMTATDGNKRG